MAAIASTGWFASLESVFYGNAPSKGARIGRTAQRKNRSLRFCIRAPLSGRTLIGVVCCGVPGASRDGLLTVGKASRLYLFGKTFRRAGVTAENRPNYPDPDGTLH
jgi:hypothetical protein